MSQLTHINASGEANMVDVSEKVSTVREARAEASSANATRNDRAHHFWAASQR